MNKGGGRGGGWPIVSNKNMAETLNKFFASVYVVQSDETPTLKEVTSARIAHISIPEEKIMSAWVVLKVRESYIYHNIRR